MIFLLWPILHLAAAHENITCFQDGQECEGHENLIDTSIVATWQECSQLCLDTSDCSAFNFFGPNSGVEPHNSCFLFYECNNKGPCNDCVIGVSQEDCLCSIAYKGVVDE